MDYPTDENHRLLENFSTEWPCDDLSSAAGSGSGSESYTEVIITSVLCAVGVVGNISNLSLLRSKKTQNGLDPVGRAAMFGLLALAWSDLLFCLLGLPSAILVALADGETTHAGINKRNLQLLRFVYRFYKVPCANILLFTSTWFIVLVSTERYLVVCHSISCRRYISIRQVVLSRLLVTVLSLLLNMPLFFRMSIQQIPEDSGCSMAVFYAVPRHSHFMDTILWLHSVTWATLGTVVPMLVLVYTNVRLSVAIKRALPVMHHFQMQEVQQLHPLQPQHTKSLHPHPNPLQHHHAHPHKPDTFRISGTLIAIAVLFILLVAPSMILRFLGSHFIDQMGNEKYAMAVSITNLLQVVKFSCNFALYCGLNKPFRESIC